MNAVPKSIVAGVLRQGLGAEFWPEYLGAFGQRHGGRPISRCALCQPEEHSAVAVTFVHYGSTPICLLHARRVAAGARYREAEARA